LLGGQLTGVPPELSLGLDTKWQTILALGFALFSLLCAMVVLPVLRRDRVGRFWTLVMLLALVPAATVASISKNLGFVAVGAFGAVTSFLVHFAGSRKRAGGTWLNQSVSWFVAAWLVLALAARVGLALASPYIPVVAQRVFALEYAAEVGDRDVVVINEPGIISFVVPFERAYRGLPLPRSLRILVPGSIPLEVRRADASTLILTAKEGDLFDCPALGPIHLAYVCKAANEWLLGGRKWETGQRVTCKGFQAEVLDLSPRGMPRSLAFHFEGPLESERKVWLYVDWRHLKHEPFVLPQIGETIEIAAAR
jgi:branched-subunit amino acid transport protein